MSCRPWTLALAAVVSAFAPSVRAQPARIPTRLDWVTNVCGDGGGFASRVLQRTKAVRFVDSRARFTVRLSIESRGAVLEAQVHIEGPDGPDTVRRIASPNCDDALDALALVVAISLEARAAELQDAMPTRPPRPPPRPRSPDATPVDPPPPPPETPVDIAAADSPRTPTLQELAPSAPAPAPSNAPVGSASPASPASNASQSEQAGSAPIPHTPEAPSGQPGRDAPAAADGVPDEGGERWAFGAGLSALLSLGVAPRPLIGAKLWLRTSWERRHALSPEVNLGVAHQRLDGFRQPGGEVDFALTVADVELCPLRIDARPLQVRPCAGGSAGNLTTSGHRTFSAASRDRPWLSFGGSLQLGALLGPLELRAAAGAAMPLVRDAFRFGPRCIDPECQGAFHRVATLIWTGAFGVGLSF